MADHRAESIATAIYNTLLNLATTRENVSRGRGRKLNDEELPALILNLASDTPGEKYNTALIDHELTFLIEGYVKNLNDTDSNPETQLNQIIKEVIVALRSDHKLGLSYVHDTNDGEIQYTIDQESEGAIAGFVMEFVVLYRRSLTDPSQ